MSGESDIEFISEIESFTAAFKVAYMISDRGPVQDHQTRPYGWLVVVLQSLVTNARRVFRFQNCVTSVCINAEIEGDDNLMTAIVKQDGNNVILLGFENTGQALLLAEKCVEITPGMLEVQS